MLLANQYPEYYDTNKLGIPINDLDCVATIGTFSATLIWLSLPRQGIWMRSQEAVDYIALFRMLGSSLFALAFLWFHGQDLMSQEVESLKLGPDERKH